MNWSNVKLILMREIRDQLRDRRTLFMIAVLPMLLYPLLGMSFFQVTQFVREHAIRVLVVGAAQRPDLPPLVEGERFARNLFDDDEDKAKAVDLLHVKSARPARAPTPRKRSFASNCARRCSRATTTWWSTSRPILANGSRHFATG